VRLLLERLELAERTRDEEARRRVEQEPLRIARDLHDITAHTLTTINVQARVAAHLLERNPLHARGALVTIEKASRQALDELRAVVGVLRGRDAGGGAPVDPAQTLGDLGGLIHRTRAGGVDVRYETRGTPGERLPDAVQLAAYRIVQESLTNVRRHASASAAHATLEFEPDRLCIGVENGGAITNGAGTGVGIIGMEERAASVGGTLAAGPSNGGFRVAAGPPFRRSE
jgi:signal transduction histidine kinase